MEMLLYKPWNDKCKTVLFISSVSEQWTSKSLLNKAEGPVFLTE